MADDGVQLSGATSGGDRRWRRRALAGVLAAGAVAGCGQARPVARPAVRGAPVVVSVTTSAAGPAAGRAPVVSGGGVRGLWQGAPWAELTVADGLVLGVSEGGEAAEVHAVRAVSGVPVWTATLRGAQPQVLGLVADGQVVVVEVGHDVGQAPEAVFPVVADYLVLGAATGRELWAVAPGGRFPAPPVAVTGNLVLTGDAAGAVTARAAATGAVVWRHRPPAVCGHLSGFGGLSPGVGLAADGPLVAVSFDCGPAVVVQRLNLATGAALWMWRSPAVAAGATAQLTVAGVARAGGLVLLAGQIAPAPAADPFTASLPRPYRWPTVLGPPDEVSTVLALDAVSGRPRWSELGGQQETFALTGGAVCEIVTTGLQCRDDVTGAPTLPALVTGQTQAAGPPYVGDQDAGVAGGIAAVIVAPLRPGAITVRAVAVRGGAMIAQAHLAIGTTASGGANVQVFAVAAGTLPSGAALVLVRRVDAPGYPVVALQVPAAQR